MDFPGRFRDYLHKEGAHMLNVSFTVERLESMYGGCAGNIAYAASLLGQQPIIVSALGKDGAQYRSYLQMKSITTEYIRQYGDDFTAVAHIINDYENKKFMPITQG